MKKKNFLSFLTLTLMYVLCNIAFSMHAMEAPPLETWVKPRPGSPAKTSVQGKRGYKIRCKGGVCRFKGKKKRGVPPQADQLLKRAAADKAAKKDKPSLFKVNCAQGKCTFKRKGLARRNKIRCKGNVCKIKGRKKRFYAKRAKRLEAYRKQLEASRTNKQAPATYKLKCGRGKCGMKQRVPGKKKGRGWRRHHRWHGRRRTRRS